MKKFVLSKSNYTLLKGLDLSEMNGKLVCFDDTNSFETSDVKLLLIIIDENIASNGMDAEQENCTEYGRALYALHDEIFHQ